MNLKEIETRKAELRSAIALEENMDKLKEMNEEIETLNVQESELKEIQEIEEKQKELEVDNSKLRKLEIQKEERNMNNNNIELRNSKEYIDAFANYIKTGKDLEVRSLLTENATSGTIAVPDLVYDIVKTAWDNNDIMKYVTKSEIIGNLQVQFESASSDAVVKTEGAAATEGSITDGIVSLVPSIITKFVSLSTEVLSMTSEKFLTYVYTALVNKVLKKTADVLVGKIAALPATATSTSPSANKITSAPAMTTIATAIANISDEASNPVIIMNKLTWTKFKEAQYANNYAVDPFEKLTVLFNNSLKSYDAASDGDVYCLVGDLGQGALANYPNGADAVKFTVDELTKKKEGLINIYAEQYVAVEVVADKAFALIAKPTSIKENAAKSKQKVVVDEQTPTEQTPSYK